MDFTETLAKISDTIIAILEKIGDIFVELFSKINAIDQEEAE